MIKKRRIQKERLVKEVQADDDRVETVPEFSYLGYMLSAGGGCELAEASHISQIGFGQVLPTTPLPPKTQSATFNQRLYVHVFSVFE